MREGGFYPGSRARAHRLVSRAPGRAVRRGRRRAVASATGKPILSATELAVADPGNPGPAAVRATGRLCYAIGNRAVTALGHLWQYAEPVTRRRPRPLLAADDRRPRAGAADVRRVAVRRVGTAPTASVRPPAHRAAPPSTTHTPAAQRARGCRAVLARDVSLAQLQQTVQPSLGTLGDTDCVAVAVDGKPVARPTRPPLCARRARSSCSSPRWPSTCSAPTSATPPRCAARSAPTVSVNGDLWLVGGGDPLLTERWWTGPRRLPAVQHDIRSSRWPTRWRPRGCTGLRPAGRRRQPLRRRVRTCPGGRRRALHRGRPDLGAAGQRLPAVADGELERPGRGRRPGARRRTGQRSASRSPVGRRRAPHRRTPR